MSPVVSPRLCPGDLRLCFCPTLQLSCPGQGWELQTGGKTGCWGRWGGYFICSSGGSLPLNVSLGTDFFLLFHPCSLCRLVHLAIIHCVPDVALCCIAQLPRELLEIQNDLFQV